MAFFDNFGKTIGKMGQDALQKGKDMADSAKINSAISDEEKRINNTYYQIGKLYFQLYADRNDEQFAALVASVRDSLQKIENYNAQLQSLRSVMKCPGCGAEIAKDSKFCNVCGTVIPEQATDVVPDGYVKCTACGNAVKSDMRFCTKCGAPMTKQPTPTPTPTPIPTPVNPRPVTPTPVNPRPVTPTPITQRPVTPPRPVTPTPVTPSQSLQCPVCHAPIEEDSLFCTECGKRLK